MISKDISGMKLVIIKLYIKSQSKLISLKLHEDMQDSLKNKIVVRGFTSQKF